MTRPNAVAGDDAPDTHAGAGEPPRAHVFPPPLERSYVVVDGRVRTRLLEAHVVDHCNLSCAGCCSLSPLLPNRLTPVDALAADLRGARRVLAPRVFKLVGGEPTLHPDIVELLRVARASEIAPKVSLTTNGLLLPRMPDAFFEAVDALTISLYPAPALPRAGIDAIVERARRFDVALNWKRQDRFVRMDRPARCADVDENRRVYDACWLRERCHLVKDGVLFSCTRPPHFASLDGGSADDDGLVLDDDVDAARVVAYLLRPEPLAACARCFGGAAESGPHRQMRRDEVERERSRLLRIVEG